MEKRYTRDEIIEKAKELAAMIAATEQVDFFTKAEAQINENQTIREKVASLKSLQKQAVTYQQYGKERGLKIVEEKIEKIQDEIEDVPVVQQFQQSQMEVNDLLQHVSTTIANTVTNHIIEATDGDLLRGETGSYVKNTTYESC